MTRIGNKPISILDGVKVNMAEGNIHIEGPQGKVDLKILKGLKVNINENKIKIETSEIDAKSIQGLFRTLVQNAVSGVKTSWTKTLELVGVGYRAQTDGVELELNLGFSHPVKIKAPDGITFKVAENKIQVLGCDKYLVGEMAASIRRLKKPEPYKGKGIRYEGEYIRKKLGKAAKAIGAAGAK